MSEENRKWRGYRCKKIASGQTEAPALISDEAVLFYHTDPKTGIVTEEGHCLQGESVKNRIVVFPGGKGSSVVQMDGLYNLDQNQTAPAGFIVQYLDTVLVSTAVIMEIPMVWKAEDAFYQDLREGDRIRLDADEGMIWILREE